MNMSFTFTPEDLPNGDIRVSIKGHSSHHSGHVDLVKDATGWNIRIGDRLEYLGEDDRDNLIYIAAMHLLRTTS